MKRFFIKVPEILALLPSICLSPDLDIEQRCASPSVSTGAKGATSGIKQPKTLYRFMRDSREVDLNLIQLKKVAEIDISKFT